MFGQAIISDSMSFWGILCGELNSSVLVTSSKFEMVVSLSDLACSGLMMASMF